jgi:hypothetical protein
MKTENAIFFMGHLLVKVDKINYKYIYILSEKTNYLKWLAFFIAGGLENVRFQRKESNQFNVSNV